jgi:hypothetical protein
MNETMSEAQLLWLVADKAEQCAAMTLGWRCCCGGLLLFLAAAAKITRAR